MLAQATVGCLSEETDPGAWWRTEHPQLEPWEDWEAWPGLDAPQAQPPTTPALEGLVEAEIDQAWRRVGQARDEAPDETWTAMAGHQLSEANRTLATGAATWSLADLVSARTTLTAVEVGDPGSHPDDREAVAAFVNESRPLDAFDEARAQLTRAWEAANVTAFPLLFALMEPWRSGRIAEGNLAAGEARPDPTSTALAAARLLALAETVDPIVENATALEGPPPAEVTNRTFAPLFDARDELLEVALDTPPIYERENGPMNRMVYWSVRSQSFQANGWTLAAATAALSALAQAQVLHQLHEDHDPRMDEVVGALERVSRIDSSAEVFLADQAWRAYRLAEDSPPFVHVPVAVDAIWPLVDAVYDRVTDGDAVDWESQLSPRLETWEDTWIETTRQDRKDA